MSLRRHEGPISTGVCRLAFWLFALWIVFHGPIEARAGSRAGAYRLEQLLVDDVSWPNVEIVLAPKEVSEGAYNEGSLGGAFRIGERIAGAPGETSLESWEPERVDVFGEKAKPLVLALVLDASTGISPYWPEVTEALGRFAAQLDARLPQSVLRVVTYGPTAQTSLLNLPNQWIEGFPALEVSTSLGHHFSEGLCSAARLLNAAPRTHRRVLLLLTDGIDDTELSESQKCERMIRKGQIPIYGIGFSSVGWSEESQILARQHLIRLSRPLGRYQQAESSAELDGALMGWLRVLERSMVLSYRVRKAPPVKLQLTIWDRGRLLALGAALDAGPRTVDNTEAGWQVPGKLLLLLLVVAIALQCGRILLWARKGVEAGKGS